MLKEYIYKFYDQSTLCEYFYFSPIKKYFAFSFRILYTCHHVFYKQLSAWMLHGLLLDQKGEFFIEKIELSQSSEVRKWI